jgi:GTP-binding protein
MIIKKSEIEITAVEPGGYPKTGFPEVALAGRSNVGKSSLINTLTNRKALARISSTHGKTRTINFYNINDSLYLVDLPGYGYASVSKVEKQKWGIMIEKYLQGRNELKLVIQLIDSRHEPTADDKLMFEWLRATGLPAVIILTKIDKLSKNELYKNTAAIKRSLNLGEGDKLVPFSSVSRQGRDEVLDIIEDICMPHQK